MLTETSGIHHPISTQDNDILKNFRYLTLDQFFIKSLKEIYFLQDTLVSILKEIEAAAITPELKKTFEDYQYQARKHLMRLERIFRIIQNLPEKTANCGIEGIIKKLRCTINSNVEKSTIHDIALVLAFKKLIYYQLASYNGLLRIAIMMKDKNIANLLEKSFLEQKRSADHLNEITTPNINFNILR
ncbi:DUF892 family protein [Elizabethkingia occulta]|uniref:DUF892 family protein n=1 Tax=Elizabethkingia occulta TaxID=1867263 RepID=UPI000999FF9E|nr:DUF892 family protein [Elizabethkingia occulta]OPB92560.1 hypothetical protein BB020_08125 [Elizabethkingia occulta]